MSNKSFVRTGGVCSILSAALYFGTIFNNLFAGPAVIYFLLGLTATILVVPFLVSIYQRFRDEANKMQLQAGVVTTLIGIPFVTSLYIIAYISSNARIYIEQATVNANSSTQPLIEMIEPILKFLNVVAIDVGSFLTFVGLGLIALSSLRVKSFPKWLAWLGIAGGILSFTWIVWGWTSLTLIIPSSGMLISLIWMIIIGAKMVKK